MPRSHAVVVALFAVAPLLRAAEIARVPPPGYVCHRAATPPDIDGAIDDAAWADVAWTSDFGDILGTKGPVPSKRTRVKMLWDEKYLYIAAEMEEPDLTATVHERDGVVFKDNDFEVFLDPKGDGYAYFELEINAVNTVWDLFLTRPYRKDGYALHDWDIKGLRTAVALKGTLNKPGDKDTGWTAEIAIPWASVTGLSNNPRLGKPPARGSEMRINFSRVEWDRIPDPSSPSGYAKKRRPDGRLAPEMNWTWAPQPAVDMHEPLAWGVLRFVDSPASARIGYVPDPDEAVRAELFRLYRAQYDYRKAHGEYAPDLAAWLKPGDTLRGTDWASAVRFAVAGGRRYVIDATSPFTGDTWTIMDDGAVSRRRAPEAVRRALGFKIWSWVRGGDTATGDMTWQRRFADARRAGVDAVLIEGSPADVARLTPYALDAGLEAHAWFWTLNRVGDDEARRHPDWFAVSRDGHSCYDKPPYSDDYRFLCPTNPDVRTHLRERFAAYASIPGISGVQSDYVRWPDVVLSKGLRRHYGLVTDREIPPYDFCYCPRCLAAFKTAAGRAPADDPEHDDAWRRFREDAVTGVVNGLRAEADRYGKLLVAAVFPYPSLARKPVRQAWDRWPLDLALPMTYNGFYEQPRAWIGEAVRRGRDEAGGRFPIYAGLYCPDIPEAQFGDYLREVRDSGAPGAALFNLNDLDPARARRLRETLDSFRRDAAK